MLAERTKNSQFLPTRPPRYCTHKFMIVRRIDTKGRFNGESTEFIFSCVEKNDPEYQRPNLRKDPTTVIED
jgi:hypothetical protein